MKTYLKQAAFVLAVIAAAKVAKAYLPLPAAATNLLP
jgi:hypothetical protein